MYQAEISIADSPDAGAGHRFALAGVALTARPSGVLWAAEARLLLVADLHLGKAERLARRGGGLLPPYETEATLARLESEVAALDPACVACLGDSFDDDRAAAALSSAHRARLGSLASGRRWLWVAGNHDPGCGGMGEAAPEAAVAGLLLRHVARPDAAPGEISGHFHPKARLPARGRLIARRCFLRDDRRVIMPAFGAYTGGLDATDAVFDALLAPDAQALLLGRRVTPAPRSRLTPRRAGA